MASGKAEVNQLIGPERPGERPNERPRDLTILQSAALLYGDWGTSKAYVIGLAFALAGRSSFWLVLAVSLLNILVGLNYILVCKFYPNGGGVYASVRERSQSFALLGGIFLMCDYIITAALSALSAFSYIGVESPQLYAIGAIFGIGVINFWGPRHTGNLAFFISAVVLLVVGILGFLAIPHLPQAWASTPWLEGSLSKNWLDFSSVVVGLSGIEAIATMTGVMKLDKGSTPDKPTVVKTSTPAIIMVMLEVSIFTALFSLAINAIPTLVVGNDTVMAGGVDVRDSMLKYMGEYFCGSYMSPMMCQIWGIGISFAFGILLLSAVNTAVIGLNSLLFVMAKDGQMPNFFTKMNSFGVPVAPLLFAVFSPIIVLYFISDLETMAHLYAIGFVGAIATNLGSTSTNPKLAMKWRERGFMFATFLVMLLIEVTLFIEKPEARAFVIAVIAVGLFLRALVLEQKEKENLFRWAHIYGKVPKGVERITKIEAPLLTGKKSDHLHDGAILCPVQAVGKTLEFAMQEAKARNKKLYVLFIREQMVVAPRRAMPSMLEDEEACLVYEHVLNYFSPEVVPFEFLYDVSNLPHINIIERAKQLKVGQVILGMPRSNRIVQLVRGDIVSEVYRKLPTDIDLVVIS